MIPSSSSPSPSLSLRPALSLLLLLAFLPSAWAADQPTESTESTESTETTKSHESMVYPGPHPEAYRTLSLAVSLLGVSALSFCVARRTAGLRAGASPGRRLLAAILIDSWVFIFSSALMTSGVGLSLNSTICTGAIFLCIIFYALSKVLIYMFLAERVYTLHAGANRLQSTAYRICLIFLLGFGIVVSLMTWGRIAFLRDGTNHSFPFTPHIMDGTDNACVIGLISPASISLLVYDLFLNVLFTSLFLYPLYRSHKLTTPLRKLAKRTLCAALVALVTSAANIAILTVVHGQQLGWVCLGSCGTDVTINALALFFVTGSYDDPAPQKPLDTVTQPVTRRRSAMPILHTSEHKQGIASHRSVHFPDTERADRGATMDYEMTIKSEGGSATRWATSNLSTAVGSDHGGVEKPKYQTRDSYLSPTGMVTSKGVIGGEQDGVPRKSWIDMADVDGVEMPTPTTPDGEQAEVQIRSEGRPPRARSGSRSRPHSRPHSRVNSWNGGRRLPIPEPNPNLDLEADTHGATDDDASSGNGRAGIVERFKALFRGGGDDEGAAQTSSASSMVIVNVRTLTEEYVDPVLDPRFGADPRRWRTRSRGSVLAEHKEEDLENAV